MEGRELNRPWWERVLDYVYSPYCPGCGRPGIYGLCEICRENVAPLRIPLTDYCTVYAGGEYSGPLKKAVLCCKKAEQTYLSYALANFIAKALPEHLKGSQRVFCVPMPANKKRRLERGFHLPELLARRLCRHFDSWIYAPQMLRLKRDLPPQKALTRHERFMNVRGAYEPGEAEGAYIVVVDDVMTTGATLFEAAQTLFKAGALRVDGIVIACA
ncbi:ComF family protein [bacterium]|nr:ComF family protein [bacterium]